MRAQERWPLWKEVSSYFSFGEWMRSSSSAEADQQRFHAEIGLEVADHRDRAATAGHDGRLRPLVRQRRLGLAQERRVVGKLDGRRAAMLVEVDRTVGRDARLDELPERGPDLLRILLVHEAERDLGRGLGGDHRLEALAGIAADNAVELGGRPRPDQFQHRAALLAGRDRQADRPEEGLGGLAQRFPGFQDLRRRLLDAVVEAGNGDAAGLVVDVGEDLRQDADRVGGGAAILARMQVAVGGVDGDLLADQAAQRRRRSPASRRPTCRCRRPARNPPSARRALASRNGFSDGEPDSSSPSNRIVTRQGSVPCTCF